ncbi:MAG: hypothetical protein E7K72_27855 [Roseomonas mucosa]|nr:hypothetical protein [Roseomonas mucosa]
MTTWQHVGRPARSAEPPPGPLRAVRYNGDAYRLQRGERIVAVALRFTNGRWGLFKKDGNRIGTESFPTPRDVCDHAKETGL